MSARSHPAHRGIDSWVVRSAGVTRRRSAVTLPAVAVLLAGALVACSSSPAGSSPGALGSSAPAVSTGSPTSPAPSTGAPTATGTGRATSTTGTTTDPTTSSATGEEAVPPPGSVPLPTDFVTIDKTITDTTVGHTITVTKIARNVAWPEGQRAQAAAFELVMIEMKWKAGTTYTAPIRTVDFALITGSTYPNRPDAILDPALVAAGWTKLPDVLAAGQEQTGWMVFKVDPKNAPTMRLEYTRPALNVLDANTTVDKKVYPVVLVGATP